MSFSSRFHLNFGPEDRPKFTGARLGDGVYRKELGWLYRDLYSRGKE